MSKRRVIFTFSEEQIRDPVIHNLGQQFNLITNIRRADLSEDKGWIVLELEGDEDDIEQGIAWVTSKGVRIDPVDGDS
ncbi:MAG: FeS-binding protein [Dehalococcoidia bacterium]|nr:MAG: FeS-binding protein [Dehalococcoidia bacterium]